MGLASVTMSSRVRTTAASSCGLISPVVVSIYSWFTPVAATLTGLWWTWFENFLHLGVTCVVFFFPKNYEYTFLCTFVPLIWFFVYFPLRIYEPMLFLCLWFWIFVLFLYIWNWFWTWTLEATHLAMIGYHSRKWEWRELFGSPKKGWRELGTKFWNGQRNLFLFKSIIRKRYVYLDSKITALICFL